ncbi:unnamed protein product [Calypogeia fissa]
MNPTTATKKQYNLALLLAPRLVVLLAPQFPAPSDPPSADSHLINSRARPSRDKHSRESSALPNSLSCSTTTPSVLSLPLVSLTASTQRQRTQVDN